MPITSWIGLLVWWGVVAFLTVFKWLNWTSGLWLSLGSFAGILLLWLDRHWLVRYYQEQKTDLLTRSPLFIISLAPLAVFVVTSTGTFLGNGLVLGILTGLLSEMWQLRLNPDAWSDHFLQNQKIRWSGSEVTHFTWAATVFVVVLSLMALRVR